ncbi:Cell cycle associated protein 1, partial [Desmophyllum pertusum]
MAVMTSPRERPGAHDRSADGQRLEQNVLNLLEKKVRNLEKRKGKLDSYKKLVETGQTLNEDQKVAVGQLTQVEQNLEFARDLQKNITQICNDHQKLQKKMAKRDQAAWLQRSVLELQALMDNLSEDVRVDFLNGTNGAVVVSEENFVQIDEFYKLITPNADGDNPMKEQQMAASRHIAKFLEANPGAVVGTT